MQGDLIRESLNIEALIKAHNEPLKERLKEINKQLHRLQLEDGRQQVNLVLERQDDEKTR
jgi:ABC-type phosphate transport system auxiliary subunit